MSQTPTSSERYLDDQRRYRLDSRLATGGMGEVWRATDTALNREVAVKVLKSEYADDPQFRVRFETEARNAASLHHPNVASVYDVGESALLGREDGSGIPRPFLVMELVDGQPLSTLLRGGQSLDPDAVRDLLAQAADAIGAAHRAGIVHRDVKPANLLVTPDRRVKITDFGIARASDGLGLTGTGQVMGTPQYLSPEQARGNVATPASDVYSLGVVAFECLAGRRPFDAESPVATALAHLNDPVPALPASVPDDLATVVRRALSKDPAERFADGDEFAAALRDPATATGRTVVPPPVVPDPLDAERTQVLSATGPLPPVPAPVPAPVAAPVAAYEDERRSPWPIVVLVLALVAVVVVIVLLVLDQDDDTTSTATDPTSASAPSSSPTSASSEPTEESSSATPEPITLDEDDYVGRPLQNVVTELKAKGLDVNAEPVANPGDEDAETVAGVDPTDGLVEGDTVTVTYYREAPETESPSPTSTPSQSPSPSQSASQSPSASASPSASPSASSSPAVGTPTAPPSAPTPTGGV